MLDDGGYIVCGQKGDAFIKSLDSAGNEVWTRYYGGAGYDHLNSIERTGDSGYIAVGSTSSWGAGEGDLWIIKTDSLGLLEISEPVTSATSPSVIVSTIGSTITLCYSLSRGEPGTLKIFDTSGRMLKRVSVRGQGEAKVAGLSAGVYFCRLEAGGVGVTIKVVIVR